MIEYWIKSQCKCGKHNWIRDSDNADVTIADLEAIECWNCQQAYWLDEEYSSSLHHATGDIGDEFASLEEFLASNPNCLAKGLKEPEI